MGFEFSETMSGTVAWDDAPDQEYPFRFEVTAHATSTRGHLTTGKAQLHGKVYAPPIAEGADAEGTILIRPLGQRVIRYELSFVAEDGRRYELIGQKDISWRAPLRTFTTLPAEILDEDHRRIGTCLTRFDMKKDGWAFLRSFRPT